MGLASHNSDSRIVLSMQAVSKLDEGSHLSEIMHTLLHAAMRTLKCDDGWLYRCPVAHRMACFGESSGDDETQQPPPHESPERPPQLQLCACRVGDVDMPRLSGLLQTTPPDCGTDPGMCAFWPDSDPELASAMHNENTVLIRISGDGNLPNHRRQFAVVPLRYAVSTENQS